MYLLCCCTLSYTFFEASQLYEDLEILKGSVFFAFFNLLHTRSVSLTHSQHIMDTTQLSVLVPLVEYYEKTLLLSLRKGIF